MKTHTIGALGFVCLAPFAALVACGGGAQTQQPANMASTSTATASDTPSSSAPVPSDTSTGGTTTPAPGGNDAQAKLDGAVKALVDAWNAHDPAKVAAAYSSSAVYRSAGMPDMNPDQVKADAANQFAGFPDFKVTVAREIEKPGVAAVEWVVTGTNTGDMKTPDGKTMKATGRPVGVRGIDIVWVDDDGKIKEDHRYFDMMTEIMQLDPKAPPGMVRPVATAPTGAPEIHVAKGNADEQKNLDAVHASMGAMNDHKADAWLATMTDESTWEDLSMPNGQMHGKADAKKWWDMMTGAFPDMKGTPSTEIAADDFVVVESTLSGTNKGPMPPVLTKPTNKSITGHGVDVIQVKDGKALHGWTYSNGVEFATQLGLMPGGAH